MQSEHATKWNVIGASVTGTSHNATGTPCQDAQSWQIHESGVLIACVADGAGSAAHSEIGAQLAVARAVELLSTALTEGGELEGPAVKSVFTKIRHEIVSHAESMGVPARQLACTLLVVIVFPEYCLQACIGDCAAVVRTQDGELLVLTAPQKGQYVNEANFLTCSSFETDFVAARVDQRIDAAILGTDGIMDWCIRGEKVSEKLIGPLFDFAAEAGAADLREQELVNFLQSPKMTARINDDLTLILCHRSGAGIAESHIFATANGCRVELANQLGKGGEGSVSAVVGQPTFVAKVYEKGYRSHAEFQDFLVNRRQKLGAMLSNRPPETDINYISIAWPLDVLFQSGRFAGYLMPRVDTSVWDHLYNFYYPRARKSRHPRFTRKNAFTAAVHLAMTIGKLHSAGHIVGDMNHANILCNDTGMITLIDTDSYSIADAAGVVFPCTSGMDEYIAPEIQGMRRGAFTWEPAHDYFSLSIHIFQLVMGCNPFDAVPRRGNTSLPVNINLIRNGVFPYVDNAVADPPPSRVRSFNSLSPPLRAAFAECFGKGCHDSTHRLNPNAWIALLSDERDRLIQCRHCQDWFEPHNPECTQCCLVDISRKVTSTGDETERHSGPAVDLLI